MERARSSSRPYSGRIVSLRVDEVEFPDGRRTTREVVEHPGAVGILPVTPEGKIVMVEQYRYAIGRTLLEIPAGTREPGEPLEETARRELLEETGYRAEAVEELARFFTSPGWANEEIVLFKAIALDGRGPMPDPDEILRVIEVDPADVPGLMRDGTIADGKTITAVSLHLAGFGL